MAGNQVVYEVSVEGTARSVGEFAKIESALGSTSKAASNIGSAFKKIAGDIDVIAGPAAAGMARSFSDAFGLVESITTSGVLGPLAAVSASIGAITFGMKQWESEEKAVKDAQIARIEKTNKAMEIAKSFIDTYVSSLKKTNEQLTTQVINERDAEISARRIFETKMRTDLLIAKARKQQLIQEKKDTSEADKDIAQASIAYSSFAEETKIKEKQYAEEKKTALEWEGLENRAKNNLEDLEEEKARKERLLKYYEQFNEKAKSFMITPGTVFAAILNDAEEEAWKQKVASMDRQVKENTAKAHDDAVKAADDIKDQISLWNSWGGVIEDVNEARTNAMLLDASQEPGRAAALMDMASQSQAYVYQRSTIVQLTEAMKQLHAEEQVGAGVNIAYGASTMVMNAMMQPLIATLQAYGSINRENWRDLLAFTDDSRDAFAAQVQQALWSLAMQAGQKSLFEVGEQYREQALAIGSAATGNFVGASLHMTSASQHGVASALYAGIAGVSGGASIGVGMQRGDGGMFGLTKEERERKERDRGGGETRMPGQGGPAARGGGGGSDGPVVVNFVYEAGAIDARSRDAAAATVAEASRHARRSGFTNRMMRA